MFTWFGNTLLVAPRPLKKLNRDLGPASRSGKCPKKSCKAMFYKCPLDKTRN